jgi:hypothetical protein
LTRTRSGKPLPSAATGVTAGSVPVPSARQPRYCSPRFETPYRSTARSASRLSAIARRLSCQSCTRRSRSGAARASTRTRPGRPADAAAFGARVAVEADVALADVELDDDVLRASMSSSRVSSAASSSKHVLPATGHRHRSGAGGRSVSGLVEQGWGAGEAHAAGRLGGSAAATARPFLLLLALLAEGVAVLGLDRVPGHASTPTVRCRAYLHGLQRADDLGLRRPARARTTQPVGGVAHPRRGSSRGTRAPGRPSGSRTSGTTGRRTRRRPWRGRSGAARRTQSPAHPLAAAALRVHPPGGERVRVRGEDREPRERRRRPRRREELEKSRRLAAVLRVRVER